MLRFICRDRLSRDDLALNPQRLVRLPLAGSFLLVLLACIIVQVITLAIVVSHPERNDVTAASEPEDEPQETFDAVWERRIAAPLEGRP